MPTYEYVCEQCGRFEHFQGMTESPLATCPRCRGPVKRIISAGAGLIFKGSGFYTTDYRKPEYEKRAKEESGKTETNAESEASTRPADTKEKDPDAAQDKVKTPSDDSKKTP